VNQNETYFGAELNRAVEQVKEGLSDYRSQYFRHVGLRFFKM
jgi:hypothetical protein